MPATYFWVDGEVVTVGKQLTTWDEETIFDMLCIDTFCVAESQVYGMYASHGEWVHIPKEDFPKEFLTTVLLLT